MFVRVHEPVRELFDLFCCFRDHIVSGVLFLLALLYSYYCLWQGKGDGAIKKERAAWSWYMAGSMCANWGGDVCPSIQGCADEGGNITVQLSKYNDSFWQNAVLAWSLHLYAQTHTYLALELRDKRVIYHSLWLESRDSGRATGKAPFITVIKFDLWVVYEDLFSLQSLSGWPLDR